MFRLSKIINSLEYLVNNGYSDKDKVLDLARSSYGLSNSELKLVKEKLSKRLSSRDGRGVAGYE